MRDEFVVQPLSETAAVSSFMWIQQLHREWEQYNFPNPDPEDALVRSVFGVVEEVGELVHAILKKKQGIRGSAEEHDTAIKDAIGDAFMYLLGVCDHSGLSMHDCVNEAWQEIRDRDWIKYPHDGRTR
jgi:NTP pyrophosphatase (non-canonical NTP hydrolase)